MSKRDISTDAGNYSKAHHAIKRPAPFKQADLARALKAARSAGLQVSRVEIDPDGKLRILIADGSPIEPTPTPFDAWKEKRNARTA
jgi:hypothetical protein